MRNALLAVFCLAACASLTGCVAGYNSVFFATKSNLGVDLETATPAIDIGIQRKEGVIAPVFEGGQTLPVMASFSSSGGVTKRFVFGASSTFSTGDAAQIMTYLYNEDTPRTKTNNGGVPTPDVVIGRVPDLPLGLKYLTPGKVKPVAFATDTSLGFRVAWSGSTAQYPSSVHLGFKRKEVAWMPVGLTVPDPAKPTEIHVDIPSLLATVDFDVRAEGSLDADLKYLQYFATGQAANNLAIQLPVRKAMLTRSDPETAASFYTQIKDGPCQSTLRSGHEFMVSEGKGDEFEERISAWLQENDRDYGWAELLYNASYEADACQFAEDEKLLRKKAFVGVSNTAETKKKEEEGVGQEVVVVVEEETEVIGDGAAVSSTPFVEPESD